MSTHDYIPKGPNAFNTFQFNFIDLVTTNKAAWGITDAAIAPLAAQKAVWDVVYPKASNEDNRSRADVLAREECQAAYTGDIRLFVNQQLRYNPLVSDPDKLRLGLHVPSGTREDAPEPDKAPLVIKIDTSESRRYTIHFGNELGERAKPAGVHGCEIYMKKGGDPPTADSEFTFAGTDTNTPFVVDFDIADIGKTVYYHLRWVNTVGVRGPWSRQESAIVP
ncbi:MAG: hypothetical protein LBD91_06165 [Prevotellaceae bacterium]|jgi:hypothetical protein|nr:hypothetical protein [Prevotellaceae bacterium]